MCSVSKNKHILIFIYLIVLLIIAPTYSMSQQKEEIAKEFDLPERKSKIATIMKHDGEAYCLCRSSDCSRFMMFV